MTDAISMYAFYGTRTAAEAAESLLDLIDDPIYVRSLDFASDAAAIGDIARGWQGMWLDEEVP